MFRKHFVRFLTTGALAGAVFVFATAACGDARQSSNGSKSTSPSSSAPRATATAPSAARSSGVPQAAAAATSAAASIAPASAAPASGGASAAAQASPGPLPDSASLDRKIIRNADVAIETKTTDQAIDSITSIVTGLGGYVANSKLTRTDDVLRGVVTVRVPSDQFDNALFQIKGLGTKVTRENITGQDVTEEYTDLDARITNLQSLADQLRQLQATIREKSNNANDIMAVYNQLSNVTGQIEQAKGRQNALSTLSNLATISAEVDPPPVTPPPPPKPQPKQAWTPARTLADAVDALSGFGQGLLQAGIWIGVLVLPLAAAAATIAFFTWRLFTTRWLASRRGTAP